MKVLSLFSGIGGLDLAAEWAGMQTVAFCERDPYCQKVLAKHWPGVPIFDDVRTLRGQDVGTVDLITGGYPCQPFSVAGKRLGDKDERHLWPEFSRLIDECRPAWVVGENVAGHIAKGLDAVCDDLESKGYAVQAFIFPASAVGAWQQRERCFIVAHADEGGCSTDEVEVFGPREAHDHGWKRAQLCGTRGGGTRALPASDVCRVVDGLPSELDMLRIGALGNAVVPQQAFPIFQSIAAIEAMQ